MRIRGSVLWWGVLSVGCAAPVEETGALPGAPAAACAVADGARYAGTASAWSYVGNDTCSWSLGTVGPLACGVRGQALECVGGTRESCSPSDGTGVARERTGLVHAVWAVRPDGALTPGGVTWDGADDTGPVAAALVSDVASLGLTDAGIHGEAVALDCTTAPDADADVFTSDVDCDDQLPTVYPGAEDPWGDQLDADCDGLDGVDADGDGVAGADGPDCDDTRASVHPGADENTGDGLDADCDGLEGVDGDGDGWFDLYDCDDADPAVATRSGTYTGAFTAESAEAGGTRSQRVQLVCTASPADGFACVGWERTEFMAPEGPVVSAQQVLWTATGQDGTLGFPGAAGAAWSCDAVSFAVNAEAYDEHGSWSYSSTVLALALDASPDLDADGFPASVDCDDARADVHIGAADDSPDGADQDCDGVDGTDMDGDGHASVATGGDDCHDDQPYVQTCG